MESILDLPQAYNQLGTAARKRFDSIFSFSLDTGKLVVPKEMVPWVEQHFGSVARLESQAIIRVTNKLTFEGALFNKLRAERPMHVEKPVKREDLLAMAATEPFAEALKHTPEDSFGRVQGESEITASNVAKYDALHGLVIFKNPDPLGFTEKETCQHYEAALAWIGAAHLHEPLGRYPAVGWNCLWKAGASLVHGHMQILLGKEPYASMLQLQSVDEAYRTAHEEGYFEALYRVHEELGLALDKDGVRIFASVTPKKEKEVVLISETADRRLFAAIHTALAVLTTRLGVESFNVAMLLPPLDGSWPAFPVVTRILDRGKLSDKTTDVAVAELYLNQSVVSSDPVKVWAALKPAL
jgi:hypothetical protein